MLQSPVWGVMCVKHESPAQRNTLIEESDPKNPEGLMVPGPGIFNPAENVREDFVHHKIVVNFLIVMGVKIFSTPSHQNVQQY